MKLLDEPSIGVGSIGVKRIKAKREKRENRDRYYCDRFRVERAGEGIRIVGRITQLIDGPIEN
jgi:hypothetical protein